MAAPPGWTPPGEFDEYRLQRRLGHGAMGQVWLALDTLLERNVAIKFLSTDDAAPEVRDRFLVEARAVARLSHPNVVTVFRVGTLDGQPYLVSEYLKGTGLDQVAKPLPVSDAARIGLELARGLAAAHRRGVLHRDVKPANAFLCETGQAKLLDFGLAKLSEGSRALLAVPAPVPVWDPAADSGDTLPAPATATPNLHSGDAPASVTRAGTVLGTPLYMAPECWVGEAATRASDVYSLGALIYELCAGRAPALYLPEGPLGQMVKLHPARPLSEVARQVDAAFASVVDRCLERDARRRIDSSEALVRELEHAVGEGGVARAPLEGNPYRGLGAFDAAHRGVFFGRGQETRDVVNRLRAEPVVLISGASGAGKSSLARAGVLPRVEEGALGEGRSWQTLTWVPGRRPLASLAAALAPLLGLPQAELQTVIASDPRELVRHLVRRLGATQGLLLFIDQFEELVTLADRDEVEAVSRALADFGLRSGGLRLLATARADLLPSLQELPGLDTELVRSLYLLGPMGSEALAQVVESPAVAAGMRFESASMVREFVEFGRTGGALPIVQFALAELYDARDSSARLMTLAALARLGGVAGSLARHADGVIEAMAPPVRRAARAVLLNLCTAENTRTQRDERELTALAPEAGGALEALVRGRLVVARTSAAGAAYELAHDALLVEWPQLKHWLHQDDRARALRSRVQLRSQEWKRLLEPRDLLWSAAQLAELDSNADAPLPELEARFVAASRRALRLARVRAISVAAAVVAVVAGGVLWTRWADRRQLEEQVGQRLAAAALARDELVGREAVEKEYRERALGAFAKNAWADAEPDWATALAQQTEIDLLRTRYVSALEAAFALDPSRPELREQLGDALRDGALFAEALHRLEEKAVALERLAAFDTAALRRAAFNAPATLVVSRPVTAVDAGGRHVEVAGRAELVPGRWTLRAGPVVLPVQLARGETLEVDVPSPASVPEQMVLVPGGRFFFGATTEEDLRRGFFETAPAHLRRTGPYLIARHELTVGEYLEFLRALPEAERERLTPGFAASTAGEAVGAGLALVRDADGYHYRLRATSVLHQAGPGEPIVYPERKTRREQRWERFPMTGISAEDVQAYARWRSKSGKLPGARLCTEEEWERAARGADLRAFPHGEVLERDDANFDVTYQRSESSFGPDEVGSHPASDSPFGVSDLSGNAWEIVRSSVDPEQFVIRGGCFFVGAATTRVYNRSATSPSLRHATVGTRICADLGTPR